MLRRIPLRLRLTAAFAAALLVVLALAAAFVYERVRGDLDETIDEGLRARADDISALAASGGTRRIQLGLDQQRLSESEEGFAQVLRGGELVGSTLPRSSGAAIDPEQTTAVATSGALFLGADVAGVEGEARILARQTGTPNGEWTVVVGTSTEDREETLSGLRSTFLVGAPLAALLISGLGYLLAGLALAPIAAALARERIFIADASHELRTPLSVLRTELELAQRRERSPQELAGVLRSAAEEVDRLSRLAEDLLVLARSDEGKLALMRERTRLADLLERVRTRFAARADQAGRDLVVEAPDGAAAELDPLRIEQALGNLVDNALRHGQGAVRLSAARNGDRTSFEVSDQGDGFSERFQADAFERFTRADQGRSGGGTGLGLAIVSAVAEAHGGEAKIVPGRGRGATVQLSVRS